MNIKNNLRCQLEKQILKRAIIDWNKVHLVIGYFLSRQKYTDNKIIFNRSLKKDLIDIPTVLSYKRLWYFPMIDYATL